MPRHFALSVLLITVLFSGCGTKGALKQRPVQTPPEVAAPAPTAPATSTVKPGTETSADDLNTGKEAAR